jgi:hypothetical protein
MEPSLKSKNERMIFWSKVVKIATKIEGEVGQSTKLLTTNNEIQSYLQNLRKKYGVFEFFQNQKIDEVRFKANLHVQRLSDFI